MPQLADFTTVCEQAARAAGEVLLDWAGRVEVREKGPADLVTEADLAAQEAIRQAVLGAFPSHGFLGEENASIPSGHDGYRWIVDPLDGTTNYVHGIPCYATSIALEQHGRLLIGAVYDPVGREFFSAALGQGATLNGRALRVSQVRELAHAVVAMSLPPRVDRHSPALVDAIEVTLKAQSMRRTGSSALNLCYVAAGRFDAYWSTTVKAWDVAAGLLIAREAGATVTSMAGGDVDLMCPHLVAASCPALHAELRGTLLNH